MVLSEVREAFWEHPRALRTHCLFWGQREKHVGRKSLWLGDDNDKRLSETGISLTQPLGRCLFRIQGHCSLAGSHKGARWGTLVEFSHQIHTDIAETGASVFSALPWRASNPFSGHIVLKVHVSFEPPLSQVLPSSPTLSLGQLFGNFLNCLG